MNLRRGPSLSEEGRATREKKREYVVRTLTEMLKENELCRLFIFQLVKKKVGFSVPRAARRHLSAARKRLRHGIHKTFMRYIHAIQS